MQALCRQSGQLPTGCILADRIELRYDVNASSSALSDVYRGQRANASDVAVKVLRVHVDNQEKVRKVCVSSGALCWAKTALTSLS
jgi:hypothetical protein